MNIDFETLWLGATQRKIQQIKEEWHWLINVVERKGYEQNIFEIGCYDGGSSWTLNHYAKNMITIDNHNPCRFDPASLNIDPNKNYTYVGGDSHHPSMEEYFKKYNWDFAFIDGDHSYEGVKADFYNILPYLKKGTPVAFHDIVISDFHHQHGCYVGEFWRDLKNEYKATKFEEIITNDEWAGIGVVIL